MGILKTLIIIATLFISSTSGSEYIYQNDYHDYNENIYKKYVEMDNQLKKVAGKSLKMLLPYLLEIRENVNISGICTRNLFNLIIGFRKLSGWSFNFLDAMGKIQSGLQTGNLQMFGEYDECIETTVMRKGKADFQGQYCSVSMKLHLPKIKRIPNINGRIEGLVNATRNSSDVMKLIVSRAQLFYAASIKMGLCMPTGCTKQDLSEILQYSFGKYVNTSVSYCLKKGDIYFWTTKRIIIVSIFVLLGLIVFISTSLHNYIESWKKNKLGIKGKILQCFSLRRNVPKLMNTDVTEKSITCLQGIRVLTIFWIILGHEYFLHALALTANHGMNYEKMLNKFFAQIVLNGFLSVETFFFMSGFVNIYIRMLIKKEGKSQPSILRVIAHRLWRIYPAYIVAFLLMYLLNKPQPYHYDLQEEFTRNCDLHWWQNFLFINNFFDPFRMCMLQSWYLCVDMQLFLFTLFTIPVLLREPKKGIILHVAVIIIVNLCSMSWWLTDYIAPSTFDAKRLDRSEAVKSFQISAYTPVHVGPYCIGIILGYVVATKRERKIPKGAQYFGWLVASLLFTSILFMTVRWNSGITYTQLESSLYGAWARTIMVLGFSWLVFCCTTGHAGLINYILSLKLWIPLSRITYMLYLVSPLIQTHYAAHLSFPEDFSDMRIIWNYFGNLSISLLMSFVLVLLVESPVIAIEKILFRRNEDEHKVPKEIIFNNTKENGLEKWMDDGKYTTIHL